MARDDPFDDLERIFDLMGGQFGGEVEDVPVDAADDGDRFVVVADLPGYDRDSLDVKLTDESTLYVGADRAGDDIEGTARYLTRERSEGAVSRTLSLPEPVREEGTTAAYEQGILTVTLPKKAAEPDTGTDIPVE
jgi:HSP20 family protein